MKVIRLFDTAFIAPIRRVIETQLRPNKIDCIVEDYRGYCFTVYNKTSAQVKSAVHRQARQPNRVQHSELL